MVKSLIDQMLLSSVSWPFSAGISLALAFQASFCLRLLLVSEPCLVKRLGEHCRGG